MCFKKNQMHWIFLAIKLELKKKRKKSDNKKKTPVSLCWGFGGTKKTQKKGCEGRRGKEE